MSHYSTGTVNVTNNSAAVVGVGTLFLANVPIGSLFAISGQGVPYFVGAVADDTHLTLSSNYAGATQSGLGYQITTSFSLNRSIPYMESGDVDTATIFKAAVVKLDQLLGRLGKQGAAVASANNLTLGTDGDYFQISGTTTINLLDNAGWNGQIVTLKFNGSLTVTNNVAASGNFKPIRLSGSANFSATALDTLSLRYDATDACWYEIGRAVI